MTMNDFRPQTIGTLAPAALEAIYAQRTDGGILGLSTGFADLDRCLDGLHRGDVVAIAGRPSMGCSTLALNIALNAATRDHRSVLVVSPGVGGLATASTLLQMHAKVGARWGGHPALLPDRRARLEQACLDLETVPLSIFARANPTVEEVDECAMSVAASRGLDLIVIDDVENFIYTDMSGWLKRLAEAQRVPVLVVAGIGRGPEARRNKRPRLSDLTSRTWAVADADVVLFLYRDDYYYADAAGNPGIAEVLVSRHPSGLRGVVKLAVSKPFGWFEDAVDDEGIDI